MATLALRNRRATYNQLVGRPNLSALMRQGVALWHPRYVVRGSSHLINLINPLLHNARSGSSDGSDSNDPTIAAPQIKGEQYLFLPGPVVGAANRVRSVQTGFWGSTNIRDIIGEVDFRPWNPISITTAYFGRHQSGSGTSTIGPGVRVSSLGNLTCYWRDSADVARTASATPEFKFGKQRIRVLLDASGPDTTVQFFFWSGSSWVQFGGTQVVSGVTGLSTVNQLALNVGEPASDRNVGTPFRAYKFEWWDGSSTSGGTLLAAPDFTDESIVKTTNDRFTDRVGIDWRILYPTSTANRRIFIVDRPWISYDGVDDYHEIPVNTVFDINSGEDFTVMVLFRGQRGTNSAFGRLVNKQTTFSSRGWTLHCRESDGHVRFRVTGDTEANGEVAGGWVSGKTHVAIGEVDWADNKVRLFLDDQPGTEQAIPNGALINGVPVRFGLRSNLISEIYNGLIGGVAIFKRKFSTNEKKRLAEELRRL